MKAALCCPLWGCTTIALAAPVIGIADGDTLTLLVDRTPVKIRLAEIDAPEKAQPFGNRSKQSLSDLCFNRDATYTQQATDRYGRVVARVSCDGIDASRHQLEKGMAWVYRKYQTDPTLSDVENQARAAGSGLWADPSPIPPWEWRRVKSRDAN